MVRLGVGVAIGVLLASCGAGRTTPPSGGAVVTQHLRAGPVAVGVSRLGDGRYRACVEAVDGLGVPGRALCVGPHDGTPGPGRAWGRADRLGGRVVVLGLFARTDSVADDRLVSLEAPGTPVAVAAGVLPDDGSGAVCLPYVSGGRRSRVTVGITVGPGGAAGAGSAQALRCADG